MDDAIVGSITAWATPAIPKGWVLCDGREYPTTGAFQPLFSIIGKRYSSSTTPAANFAVPDLRGRIPLGSSSAYALGSKGGSLNVTVQQANLPEHQHAMQGYISYMISMPPVNVNASFKASANYGNTTSPNGNYLANAKYSSYTGNNFTPSSGSLSAVGGLDMTVTPSSFQIPFPTVTLDIKTVGGGQPIHPLPPYRAVEFIICYDGAYLTRA